MSVLNEARNLATRAFASFLAAALFWSTLAAFRAAFMRDEACDSAASAWARSLAIWERTWWKLAAVWAVTSLILLLAHMRYFLSWVAAWAASLERPLRASASMLFILLSKAFMALSRSWRAFLAFSLIWAAFTAMWWFVFLILALVAEARVARARCWFSTASRSSLAPSALFLRMISRVLRERRMVWR